MYNCDYLIVNNELWCLIYLYEFYQHIAFSICSIHVIVLLQAAKHVKIDCDQCLTTSTLIVTSVYIVSQVKNLQWTGLKIGVKIQIALPQALNYSDIYQDWQYKPTHNVPQAVNSDNIDRNRRLNNTDNRHWSCFYFQ